MTPVRLSYSSGNLVNKCQQKYFYYKVANTPKDEDYEESEALGFGKAFHQVLEKTLHNSYNENLILEAMTEHNVDMSEKPLLTAMLDNYIKLHKKSGLSVVRCELPIETPVFVGFIDFIAQAENGWWIGDNKTASRHDPNILPRLPMDMQLNLYAYFAPEIGRQLEMKGPFLGCRYRQSIKSKAGTAAGLARGTPTYDIEVPLSVMNPSYAWSLHLENQTVAQALHNGLAPTKNFGACYDFFSPCPYFSKCHGDLFSKNSSKVHVHTIESLEDSDLL